MIETAALFFTFMIETFYSLAITPTLSIITAGQLFLEKTVKNNKQISATHFPDS
jgi:hypothetical protein